MGYVKPNLLDKRNHFFEPVSLTWKTEIPSIPSVESEATAEGSVTFYPSFRGTRLHRSQTGE